jgi:hypothetical protein
MTIIKRQSTKYRSGPVQRFGDNSTRYLDECNKPLANQSPLALREITGLAKPAKYP